MLNMSATQLFRNAIKDCSFAQKEGKHLDAQRNIVVSTPGSLFGDDRQQVLILTEPRWKEGWCWVLGDGVGYSRKGCTHGD